MTEALDQHLPYQNVVDDDEGCSSKKGRFEEEERLHIVEFDQWLDSLQTEDVNEQWNNSLETMNNELKGGRPFSPQGTPPASPPRPIPALVERDDVRRGRPKTNTATRRIVLRGRGHRT